MTKNTSSEKSEPLFVPAFCDCIGPDEESMPSEYMIFLNKDEPEKCALVCQQCGGVSALEVHPRNFTHVEAKELQQRLGITDDF